MSLPDALGEMVKARAEAENRPFSNMIATLLQEALDYGPGKVYQGGREVAFGGKEFRGPDPKPGGKG